MASSKTEADLESRMHAVMTHAFPWLPADAIRHQTRFTVRLGHSVIAIDGRTRERVDGRADMIVFAHNDALAVFELKRPGVALTDDDVAQGLSYARLMTPIVPLVVVSNGTDTRICVTHSGDAWSPIEHTENELQACIRNAALAATSDVREAVKTLMGTESLRWIQALKAVSASVIETRTGDWHDLSSPFVRGFVLRRKAAALVVEALKQGQRAVVLHGPPLSGKSNVLRQLCEDTRDRSDVAVLMLEPDAAGLFETISNHLSSELSWTLSSSEARDWSRRVSHTTGATLWLALDGVDPTMSRVLADLNELSSSRYGPGLRIIVTADDSALDGIMKKPTGREKSAFGKIVKEIPLHPLDDIEFNQAQATLIDHRIEVTRGGELVQSLREPWTLRALVPADLSSMPTDTPSWVVRIPPLMDIDALHRAVEAFPLDDDADVLLREAAGAILDSYLESRNSVALLQGITTFAVERRRLEETVSTSGIGELRRRGLIKPGIDWAERPTWFVRVPALMAMHIATVLSARMADWKDSEHAADQLIAVASRMPLGDLIAAEAIVRRIHRDSGADVLDLLSALLQRSPTASNLTPGSRMAFALSGKPVVATVTQTGKLSVRSEHGTIEIDLAEDGLLDPMTDFGGWLILSHLAGVPIATYVSGEDQPARLDEPLLLELAQAKVVLSRPDGVYDFKEVVVHDIPGHGSFVCNRSGIVEPITWALVNYFLQCGPDAASWIGEAIAKDSLALLTRVHIALTHVAEVADIRGAWALTALSEHVNPALARFPMHH